MKRHFWLFPLLFACAFAVLATVKTDHSHSVDFSHYKTYSWIKISVEDPLWEDRVTRAVDSQLSAKGWTKVDSDGDAAVAAYGSTHTQKTLQTWYDGFGGGWYWRGFGDGLATTTVQETPVGTLMIDIFDGPTKKLIWRGVASDTLSGKPEKDEKKMDKAVAEMFKNFPPAPKG
jgi:predicted outer membrane lipoprotein